MTAEEYRNAMKTVAYLAACAVNGTVPEEERLAGTDPDVLLQAAAKHKLAGITAQALESAGIRTEATARAKGNALRKVILLDAEKNAILERFEAAGIWYMPLKGAILKDMYPALGMREMSDIDILIDPERMEDADGIMREMGYEKEEESGAHNSFHKEPVYHIELHKRLFSPLVGNKALYRYYENVWDRALPDGKNSFGYRFNDEDFYIYMIAHEYKHYYLGGTGLRSLLDTYLYCTCKGDDLDWDYICTEIKKLDISGFEEKNRSLAMTLFRGEDLNEAQQEILDYVISSGAYGTVRNRVDNSIANVNRYGKGFGAKIRYLFRRLYPPMDVVKETFPFFAKHPVLLPVLPLYRAMRSTKAHRDIVKAELKGVLTHKTKE
jgi:hypothetical protein